MEILYQVLLSTANLTVAGSYNSVTREIVSVTPAGDSLTVRILQDIVGLRIDEAFSSHAQIELIDSAGGTFDAVNRSNED